MKAIKIVAGVALFVAGVATGNPGLILAGVSVTSSAVMPTPKMPPSQTQRLNASIDPRAFRKEVLGQTAMATDIRYEEWSGSDQQYCDWIVCVASHAIDGIDEIWLDSELAWTAGGGVQGRFRGYFAVPTIITEGSPANAFSFGRWNSAHHRLTGCAYLRLRFKVTGNSKKAESPFSSGPTGRITIIGRGALIYDPRRDSTVPGGSGPMRIDDQGTWRFTADDGARIGENLPLLALRRLIGWRILNPATGVRKLATGAGLPAKRIDLQSFIVAANLADELVNRSAGGQEPRYHGAGVASEGDDPGGVLDALCAGMCARLTDAGGRIGIRIAHNDLAVAATDPGLDTDDVIGAFSFDPDPAIDQAPNVIRGRYVDASTNSLYQLVDYPEVRIPSVDGIDRIFTLDLGFVESASQAQRIARQVLQRKQYERSFEAPFDIRAWGWPQDAVVPFTFAPLGFVRQLFRVESQTIGRDGSCPMRLSWETPAIYAWDADDRAPVQAAEAVVYDPTRAPIVQAVSEAATAAVRQAIASSFPVDVAISAAADGTVTIGDHLRRYTDGHADVEVAGATIATALPAGTFRAIAYDDPDREGGAVTYLLSEGGFDTLASPAHPFRHFVGNFVIPASGSPPASGGSGQPPGGGGYRNPNVQQQ